MFEIEKNIYKNKRTMLDHLFDFLELEYLLGVLFISFELVLLLRI